MKRKFFQLSTLFSILLTLFLASSGVAQVVPTDADQPHGIPTRIICKSNTCETKSGNSPILSQAINFVIKSALVYGTTYIVERIVSKLFTRRSAVHSMVNCSVAPLRATNHRQGFCVLCALSVFCGYEHKINERE